MDVTTVVPHVQSVYYCTTGVKFVNYNGLYSL